MRQKITIYPLALVIAVLVLFGLACGGTTGGSTAVSGGQTDTPQANTQAAVNNNAPAATDTLSPTDTKSGNPAGGATLAVGATLNVGEASGGGSAVTDDFSKGNGNWALPSSGGIKIDGGVLTAGPFSMSQCMFITDPDSSAQTAMDASCFAVCKTCGVAQNYTMQVDIKRNQDAEADRWLMVVLRFDDQNNNNIAEINKDYILGFGFRPGDPGQNFGAWEFVPFDRNQPWHPSFQDRGPLQANTYTTLKFVSYNDGQKIDIFADGNKFSTWVEHKADVIVNERLLWSQQANVKGAPHSRMTPIITKGKVGLGVMEKGGAVEYSNFSFQPQ